MEPIINRERIITFLLETPMFEKLDPSEIMEVMHIIEIKQYKAGDIIFSEGEPGRCLVRALPRHRGCPEAWLDR